MNEAVRGVQRVEADIVALTSHAAHKSEPICFILDPKPGIGLLVANVCDDLGLQPHRFESFAAMLDASERVRPDVIFLEPGIDGRDGDDVIPALAAAGFRCPIQLMSGLNAVLTEEAAGLASGTA